MVASPWLRRCWPTVESAWERVRALAEQNQLAAAKRVGARALDANGKPVDPKLLAQAIDRPAAFLVAHERRLTQIQRELAIVAIVRLARDSPSDAAGYAVALNLHLTPEQRGIVWGRIGHMAALRGLAEANEWSQRGGAHVGVGADAARVDEVVVWQVRAALRVGDWASVKSTIERMPATLRADPAWVYWYGRALKAQQRPAEAQDRFAEIAAQFHFYGELAAEELGMPIVLPPRAPVPTAEELAPMAVNPGFARAQKFYELGLRTEGNREWYWQLRGMSDRQLLAAAEYARSQSLLDRMINTSRTGPAASTTSRSASRRRSATRSFSMPCRSASRRPGSVRAMRQESRFIMDLRSHAGASGSMQLMPATARYVARKLNARDFTIARVNERDVNLQLGTAYLKMVLDDLRATSCSRPPPRRRSSPPRAWRSTLVRPVEGAIFAETIPFDETRDYVKKVMSNTALYARVSSERRVTQGAARHHRAEGGRDHGLALGRRQR